MDWMQQARRVLHEKFGWNEFRPGQETVIQALLEGRSSVAVFPTGGGKSLCYQLPALLLPGTTIVVSPLMALMKDQVEQLTARGISAARLDSTMTADEVRQTNDRVKSQECKILYVAPERFFNERFRRQLDHLSISLFAIDEAHCISQWGHNFRPDYLKLSRIAQSYSAQRVLALTATATPAVLNDIKKEFNIAEADCVRTSFYRPNLSLQFARVPHEKAKKTALLSDLRQNAKGATIIYVSLQKTAEDIAQWLCENEIPARAYHAGLESNVREEVQNWFMQSEDAVVVATIAFGMGVDKSNIRFVYHFNFSKSLEAYAQEIGRAGRDGLSSLCKTFYDPSDRIALENFAYGDTPEPESIHRLIELVAHQPPEFFLSYYSLSSQCDVRESVLRTVITYLELDEYIEPVASRYEKYEYKPLKSMTSMLGRFTGKKKTLLSDLFSLAVKKKIWFEIHLPLAILRLKCERHDIVELLDELSGLGDLELKVSGLVHGFRHRNNVSDIELLSNRVYEQLLQRESHEIHRLDQVRELIESNRCQYRQLAQHFGEELTLPCENCSACRNSRESQSKTEVVSSQLPIARIGDSATKSLDEAISLKPEILATPRQKARFLCGLSSPAFTRARISKIPGFGCCNTLPFSEVLDILSKQC